MFIFIIKSRTVITLPRQPYEWMNDGMNDFNMIAQRFQSHDDGPVLYSNHDKRNHIAYSQLLTIFTINNVLVQILKLTIMWRLLIH